jgi:hypothetical protein
VQSACGTYLETTSACLTNGYLKKRRRTELQKCCRDDREQNAHSRGEAVPRNRSKLRCLWIRRHRIQRSRCTSHLLLCTLLQMQSPSSKFQRIDWDRNQTRNDRSYPNRNRGGGAREKKMNRRTSDLVFRVPSSSICDVCSGAATCTYLIRNFGIILCGGCYALSTIFTDIASKQNFIEDCRVYIATQALERK